MSVTLNVSKQIDSSSEQTKIEEPNTDMKGLLTVRQFCRRYPWPSESAMRAYVYRAEELGISDAFFRVRRRVLVDPVRFFILIKQVESRSTKGGNYETTSWRKGKAHL